MKWKDIKESVKHFFMAMEHYEFALVVWEAKSPKTGIVLKSSEPLIIKEYPITDKLIEEGGARVITNKYGSNMNYLMPEVVLSIVWKEASKETANAEKLSHIMERRYHVLMN